MKRCTRCGHERSCEDFLKSDQTRDGLGIYCRDCRREQAREGYERLKADPEKFERRRQYLKDHHRRQHLLRRYGLTLDDYERLLAAQGGVCAGCQQPPGVGGREVLSVDHDHSCCPESGRSCGACIRGLLCTNCNTILAMAGDSPDRLYALAAYVTQPRLIQVSA